MNYIDEEKLLKTIEKLEMYIRDESINFETLKRLMRDMQYDYTSKNSTLLYETQCDFNRKFNTIHRIHNDYITIFKKTVLKYKTVRKQTEQKFSRIKKDL